MAGECKRCCFYPKGRCQNGYDCKFCHFEHDKRKRAALSTPGVKAPGWLVPGVKKPFTPTGGHLKELSPLAGR